MPDQAEARAQLQARAFAASRELMEHTAACESCAEQLSTNADDAPDCTVGARVYGDWLAALMMLATTPRAEP